MLFWVLDYSAVRFISISLWRGGPTEHNAPANIGEIEHSQADIILMVCDRKVRFQAENLRITDIGPV